MTSLNPTPVIALKHKRPTRRGGIDKKKVMNTVNEIKNEETKLPPLRIDINIAVCGVYEVFSKTKEYEVINLLKNKQLCGK